MLDLLTLNDVPIWVAAEWAESRGHKLVLHNGAISGIEYEGTGKEISDLEKNHLEVNRVVREVLIDLLRAYDKAMTRLDELSRLPWAQ